MGNRLGNEKFVGKVKADGTSYKLMHDEDLKRMLVKWIYGASINDLCEEFRISRIQFHRQKYYKEKMLRDLIEEVRSMVNQDMNSVEIGQELGIPFEQVNIIISTML